MSLRKIWPRKHRIPYTLIKSEFTHKTRIFLTVNNPCQVLSKLPGTWNICGKCPVAFWDNSPWPKSEILNQSVSHRLLNDSIRLEDEREPLFGERSCAKVEWVIGTTRAICRKTADRHIEGVVSLIFRS